MDHSVNSRFFEDSFSGLTSLTVQLGFMHYVTDGPTSKSGQGASAITFVTPAGPIGTTSRLASILFVML